MLESMKRLIANRPPVTRRGRQFGGVHHTQLERLKANLGNRPSELMAAARTPIATPKFLYKWADGQLPDPWSEYGSDAQLLDSTQFQTSDEQERAEMLAREFLLSQRSKGDRSSLYVEGGE